jgi:hypothetical protein
MSRAIDRDGELDRLSEDSLRDRLRLAERAVVLFGWCQSRSRESARDKAAFDAWMAWAAYVGPERTGPKGNRELNEKLLIEEERWRALLLIVKAKLEAVDSGIVTFEQEFLPHIVMPGGHTVYEATAPAIERAYVSGQVTPLLQIEGTS